MENTLWDITRWPKLCQWSIFIPTENIRKSLVFSYLPRVKKESSDMKWLNSFQHSSTVSCKNQSHDLHCKSNDWFLYEIQHLTETGYSEKSAFPARDIYGKWDIYKSLVHVFIYLRQYNMWVVYKVRYKGKVKSVIKWFFNIAT